MFADELWQCSIEQHFSWSKRNPCWNLVLLKCRWDRPTYWWDRVQTAQWPDCKDAFFLRRDDLRIQDESESRGISNNIFQNQRPEKKNHQNASSKREDPQILGLWLWVNVLMPRWQWCWVEEADRHLSALPGIADSAWWPGETPVMMQFPTWTHAFVLALLRSCVQNLLILDVPRGLATTVLSEKGNTGFVIGISSNLPKTTKQWPPEFMKRHGCVLTRFRSDETLSHTLKGSIPWMAPEAWHGLTISEVTFFTEKGKLVFGFSFHEFIPLDKDIQGHAIEHFSHVFNSYVHYPSWLILLEISTHFLCMISFNTPITYSHRHTVALTSWRASWSSCKKGNVFVCAL